MESPVTKLYEEVEHTERTECKKQGFKHVQNHARRTVAAYLYSLEFIPVVLGLNSLYLEHDIFVKVFCKRCAEENYKSYRAVYRRPQQYGVYHARGEGVGKHACGVARGEYFYGKVCKRNVVQTGYYCGKQQTRPEDDLVRNRFMPRRRSISRNGFCSADRAHNGVSGIAVQAVCGRRAFGRFRLCRARFKRCEEGSLHKHRAQRNYKRERRRKRNAVGKFFPEPNLVRTAFARINAERGVEEFNSVFNAFPVVHFKAVVCLFAVDYPVSAVGHVAVAVVVSDLVVAVVVSAYFVYEPQTITSKAEVSVW